MKENKELPESVTLSGGQVATKRSNLKVRDLANAEAQAQGKEHLVKYSQFAAKIFIDGKIVVLEDILDLPEEDLEIIAGLFVSDDELKNV